MTQQKTSNGLLLGALIGGAVGAISALLLAPKSGAELRDDLSTKLQAVSEKTKDICSNVGQTTKELAATVGQHTKDLATNIKDETADLVEQAKKSNQNIMDSLSSSKEDVKEELASTGR